MCIDLIFLLCMLCPMLCHAGQSAREGNLVEMMRAFASGADVNWRNPEDHCKTCLHVACAEVRLFLW